MFNGSKNKPNTWDLPGIRVWKMSNKQQRRNHCFFKGRL